MEELKKIIIELVEITSPIFGDKASADRILDCATRLHISNNISKERNGGSTRPQATLMASPKQKDFLKKHSCLDPAEIDGMSKLTASPIIDEIMKKWNN